MEKGVLKNFEVFDDSELALIVALKNMVGQLGEPFQRAADALFNRLYQATAELPVFIRIDEPVRLDARLLAGAARAIRERKQVRFGYKVRSPYEVVMEPYRIAYFDGFWYLVGKDMRDSRIKRYALDKMKDLRMEKKGFKTVPPDLDEALHQAVNIWFSSERNLEVVTLVEKCCAHYFKRRKMFPTQEIKEERPDGSLVVSFRVSCFEEIENPLKVWLPHIKVLRPKELKMALLKQMKQWVTEQGKEDGIRPP
jgi:predicted DNA-binding transcriptional regulator YafY